MRLNCHRGIPWGKKTYLMGVVNVTPDSFSNDGLIDCARAVERCLEHVSRGADIIDVGAQSTRPGHVPVDEETEAARLTPVLVQVREKTDALISVDTSKAEIAELALSLGADIINLVEPDSDGLLSVLSKYKPNVVLMHNKPIEPGQTMTQVCRHLQNDAAKLQELGLARHQIILDPGFGFNKNADQNLEIMKDLSSLVDLGYPTLLGTSRKSTIGKLLAKPVDDRVFGTAATVAIAAQCGIDIVRVHDVREMNDVLRVCDAIYKGWRPESWPHETTRVLV